MIEKYLKTLTDTNEEYISRAVERFDLYRSLLIEWNNKFNLTSITQKEEIDSLHFIDSLLGLDFVKGKVLDVGSGAGFPSIPLAILKSDLDFTLVDSLNKRVNFLKEVILQLNLKNCTAIHSRAEDLDKSKLYDTVVARAVAPLRILVEYTLPFLKIGGYFVAYKSMDIDEEINLSKNAVKILGGKIERVIEKPLFSTDIVRKLVLIKKIDDCDKSYPRAGNKPKSNPL